MCKNMKKMLMRKHQTIRLPMERIKFSELSPTIHIILPPRKKLQKNCNWMRTPENFY